MNEPAALTKFRCECGRLLLVEGQVIGKEHGVEAGDRALETAKEIRGMFGDGDNCAICKATVAKIAALIQSAMNAQERELVENLQPFFVAVRVMVAGHAQGSEHHPELHLCESCRSNVAELCEYLKTTERLLAERGEGR